MPFIYRAVQNPFRIIVLSMKIILVGYMGSGKSSVGKLIAQKLSLPFLDLDEEIKNEENKEIHEIFRTSGEIYFRKKESEVLKNLLSSSESFVLSLGGGTPCYGKNLQLMKDEEKTILVYLKTSLETLVKRLMREKDVRPLISHLTTKASLEDFIRKHLFERTFYYNQSDLVLGTDGKTVGEVADEISQGLG